MLMGVAEGEFDWLFAGLGLVVVFVGILLILGIVALVSLLFHRRKMKGRKRAGQDMPPRWFGREGAKC